MPPGVGTPVPEQCGGLLRGSRRLSKQVSCPSYKIRRYIFPSKHTSLTMATQIKFGTSGWRAVVAEEFTFENVRRAVHGISRYVVSQKTKSPKVIVGRDPRFLGETFVAMAAEILSGYQITPLLIAEAAPTPAISYAVTQAKADGAINFTASHNPPEYNGIKFSTSDGAPALPEVTKAIEAEIAAYDQGRTGQRPVATRVVP